MRFRKRNPRGKLLKIYIAFSHLNFGLIHTKSPRVCLFVIEGDTAKLSSFGRTLQTLGGRNFWAHSFLQARGRFNEQKEKAKHRQQTKPNE